MKPPTGSTQTPFAADFALCRGLRFVALLFVLLAVAACGSSESARSGSDAPRAEARAQAAAGDMGARAEAYLDTVSARLDLSAQQEEEVRPVLARSLRERVELMREFREAGRNRESVRQLRSDAQAIERETKAELEIMLTEEQMAEYEELRAEERAQMRERMRQRRGGGRQRLEKIFERVDRDGDGQLSEEEVQPHPRLKALHQQADDGNGRVSLAEFRVEVARRMKEAQSAGEGDLRTRTVTADGRERSYQVYVPDGYEAGTPTPVVLVFHGGGGSADSMRRLSGLSEKAEEAGFIAVYPRGSGRANRFLSWNGGGCCGYAQRLGVDDVSYVRALLDDVATAVTVDSNRVFATGISNGGIMAYRVAEELSGQIAAIAPVAATMGSDTADPEHPVAVLHFHGTDDALLPFEGGFGKRPGGGRGPVEYVPVEQVLRAWRRANGCSGTSTVEPLPDTADDGTRAVRKTWDECASGAPVVLVEIDGGGHTWPGRPSPGGPLGASTKDISANDMMWRFFEAHPQGPPVPLGAGASAALGQRSPSGAPSGASSQEPPVPGSRKALPSGDAARDAAQAQPLFEGVHVPGFTDVIEGLNGFALGDVDQNGYLDLVTIRTPPYELKSDPNMAPQTGEVERTDQPRDRLRLLLNRGGWRFEPHPVALHGTAATPEDFSQGWRGAQIPALADFNQDGWLDLYVSRQAPMRGGRMISGRTPLGSSLLVTQGAFDVFQDVSKATGIRNLRAYNRQMSLGDVNGDGFIDIAQGADNVVNAFNGLPISALFVFEPEGGQFAGGQFKDVGRTARIPDFGGFHDDPERDRGAPNIALRDVDNDGDLDLMQSAHTVLVPRVPPSTPLSPAEYRQGTFSWRNMERETDSLWFEKVTENGFAAENRMIYDREAGRFMPHTDADAVGLGYLFFADVNNDARLDALAVGNAHPFLGPPPADVGARFWYNRGDLQFEQGTEAAGLGALNWSYRRWHTFFDAPLPQALRNYTPTGAGPPSQPGRTPENPLAYRPAYADAAFADFDNDGWQDLVVLDRKGTGEGHPGFSVRALFFMNEGDGTFAPRPTTFSGLATTGLSVEAADLNNDGLVDLIFAADPDNSGVATRRAQYESTVYLNTGRHGGAANNWLRLRFAGVSDAALLGAHVMIQPPGEHGETLGMRGLYSNHSYKSSSPFQAHFGLGDREAVDVEIRLIGGRTVMLDDVAANQFVEVDLANETVQPVEEHVGESQAPPERSRASKARGSGRAAPSDARRSTDDDTVSNAANVSKRVRARRAASDCPAASAAFSDEVARKVAGEWRLTTRSGKERGETAPSRLLRFERANGTLRGTLASPGGAKRLCDLRHEGDTLKWFVRTVESGETLSRRRQIFVGPRVRYEATLRDSYFRGFARAYYGAREITGRKVGSGAEPPPVEAPAYAAAYADGEAFTFLREETFSIGGQSRTVAIYRSNLFAEALGLGEGETRPEVEFVLVPGGAFQMGLSPETEEAISRASRPDATADEQPQHRVRVEPFLMARTELTQQLWRELAPLAGLPFEPSFFGEASPQAPVEMVSWHHARQWLTGINDVYDLALRLPTEAEWEYACRAGTQAPLYNGTVPAHPRQSPNLDPLAWYVGNSAVDYPGATDVSAWGAGLPSASGTHPVGQKRPNAFGLYDMLGNVMEWVRDLAHPSYAGAPPDGSAWRGGDWESGSLLNGPMTAEGPLVTVRDARYVPGRIRRGGSWRNVALNTRCGLRSARGPNFTDANNGLRVAAPAPSAIRK